MNSKRRYMVVDRNGKPVAEPFDSERKAYEAMAVYRDHCTDVDLPMKVISEGEWEAGHKALLDAYSAAQGN